MNKPDLIKIKSKIKTIIKFTTIIILIISILYSANTFINLKRQFTNDNNSVYVLSQYGSRGNEVRKIQTKLKQLGYYNGSIDGIFGSDTKKAVIKFQKSCGITADGVAGPKTLLY